MLILNRKDDSQDHFDCLIIGAGPAGISAALYLIRYRRNIIIVDEGASRTLMIPKSHNYPAFVKGISGPEILKRLKAQLKEYGGEIIAERIESIVIDPNGYFISNNKIKSKTIILATGVMDIEPALPHLEQAVRMGFIRHCPVCDAYEVIDQNIAVIGKGTKGLEEALTMRRYSKHVTFLTLGSGLNQICVAQAHGAITATAVNKYCKNRNLTKPNI